MKVTSQPSTTSVSSQQPASQSLGSTSRPAGGSQTPDRTDASSLENPSSANKLLGTDQKAASDETLRQLPGVNQRVSAAALLSAARSGGRIPDPMPADQYFGSREITQSIDATYGAGSAARLAKADQLSKRGEAALEAALGGASRGELVKMLGEKNPESGAMADKILNVAKAMKAKPANEAAVNRAIAEAHHGFITYGAPGDPVAQGKLARLFREEYGAGDPSQINWNGGGPLAGQANAAGFSGPSPSGDNALELAQSQIGVREATGNNDGLPAQRYSNGRQEPWCANFVAWSFRESGNPLPGNQRRLASVQYMEDQMKAAGRWAPRDAATPRPGDVIFFGDRGDSDAGNGRHVGMVEKVENGRVYTVEGNSSNGVRRRSYPLNHPRITGWGSSS